MLQKIYLFVSFFFGFFLYFQVSAVRRKLKKKSAVTHIKLVDIEKLVEEKKIDLSNATCEVCGVKITPKNLAAIKISEGKYKFFCSSKRCMTIGEIL